MIRSGHLHIISLLLSLILEILRQISNNKHFPAFFEISVHFLRIFELKIVKAKNKEIAFVFRPAHDWRIGLP